MKKLRVKTSPKAVIIQGQQLLVVVKQFSGMTTYILPGGRLKFGEDLTAGLKRECLEELGTDVVVGRLLWVREYIGKNHQFAATDSQEHIVDILFACRVPPGYLPQTGSRPDSEQTGVEWLPVERLQSYNFFPRAIIPLIQRFDQEQPGENHYLGDVN